MVIVDKKDLLYLEEQIRREEPKRYKTLTRWNLIKSIIEGAKDANPA